MVGGGGSGACLTASSLLQTHSHGVYVLRSYYVRKGTSDLFHGNPGVIEVYHYRIIRFLPRA